jgi:hypothetical protein
VAAINIAVPIFTASGTTRSDQATVQIQRLIPDNPLVPARERLAEFLEALLDLLECELFGYHGDIVLRGEAGRPADRAEIDNLRQILPEKNAGHSR